MWKTKDELRIVSSIAEAFNLNFEELEFSTKFNKEDIDVPIQKLEKCLGVNINRSEIENIVNAYQLVIFLQRLLSKEEHLESVDYYVDGSISVYMNSDNHGKFKQKQIADWKEKNINLSMNLMITPLCPSIGYYVKVGDIQVPKDVFPDEYEAINKALYSVYEKMSEYRKKRHEEDPSLKAMEMKRFVHFLSSFGKDQ